MSWLKINKKLINIYNSIKINIKIIASLFSTFKWSNFCVVSGLVYLKSFGRVNLRDQQRSSSCV